MQTTSQQSPKKARKPYVAPLLEEYGQVRELTRTNAFEGNLLLDSGGVGANIYQSAT